MELTGGLISFSHLQRQLNRENLNELLGSRPTQPHSEANLTAAREARQMAK